MEVLATGADGFIGTHLTEALGRYRMDEFLASKRLFME